MIIHDKLGVRGEYDVLPRDTLKPGEAAREFMRLGCEDVEVYGIRLLVVNPDREDYEGFYHHGTSSITLRNRNDHNASLHVSSDTEPNLQAAVKAFETAGLKLKGREI
tara:strand:- start:2336 stop:2659 length:324 start_codon:yes stop_codon:yes gene_type:complete